MSRSLWRRYNSLLNQKPVATQLVTAAILAAAGDLIAQLVIGSKSFSEYSFLKTLRMVSYAVLIATPLCMKWMKVLDKMLPGQGGWRPLQKMLVDQILMGPLFNVIFILYMELSSGGTLANGLKLIPTLLPRIMWNAYKVWPAVQLVNFYFVPPNLRVVVGCLVGLLWGTYLAVITA